jgi:hypothetical protein
VTGNVCHPAEPAISPAPILNPVITGGGCSLNAADTLNGGIGWSPWMMTMIPIVLAGARRRFKK